jgi:hypothetical protein
MQGRKEEAPRLGLYVLARVGAALRSEVDERWESEVPLRMRSLLIELQRLDTRSQDGRVKITTCL